MKKSLYLETSVVGAYLDNGEPFRRDLTIRWWEHELADYSPVISPLVIRELERTEEPRRSAYLNLVRDLPMVEVTEEAAILADGYVEKGIFHRKYLADALHVALASVAKAASLKAERAAIEQTLRQVHWNRRKAAVSLGVSYKTLLNKIKECGISRD